MRRVSVSLRPAVPADFDRIEAIENEADQLLGEWLGLEQGDPAPAGASRAADPGFLLVAENHDGVLVGFVHVLEIDGHAHLEQVSVAPEHGRRGYGRLLVEAAKDGAQRRGYSRITLRTFADVPWNAPFYARVGFVEEEAGTPFHRRLIETETRLGLDQYGRRIQMAARL